MQKKLPLPVGTSDFKEVCQNYYYVDKTLFIKEFLDEGTTVSLFTRPRRFGKTLNMDMLRTFFEKSPNDASIYFCDKVIWSQGEDYTRHQGKYPVIFLSLKDIKGNDWKTSFELLKRIIRAEYSRHEELEASSNVKNSDIDIYKKITTNTADDYDYIFSLHCLSKMLHEHHGIAPIIIIDEYDTPIQEGYLKNYYDEAISFIRNFFSSALKDNPHMSYGILTGILKVAKESIFSGLNNVTVYSVLDKKFGTCFGFTIEEVQQIAQYYNHSEKVDELKKWYDGYSYGGTEIFNPWSVINYFKNECKAIPYWVRTSENATIREVIKNANPLVCENLKKLLAGDEVNIQVATDTIYPKLKDLQTNIFGFLLMTGYLKTVEVATTDEGNQLCRLQIPNKEIKSVYSNEILSMISESIGEDIVEPLRQAILDKNASRLQFLLSEYLKQTVSYYDGLKESYYHGLLLGMSVIFQKDYYPISNRESGTGRYDIQLKPKNKALPGIIIELKATSNKEELHSLAQKALEQIEENAYDTEMRREGIDVIYKFGIACFKKQVEIVTN